jgi:hypothetical protein
MEEDAPTSHDITAEYATYEEFLDSQITALDLYYLEVSQRFPIEAGSFFSYIEMNPQRTKN